MTSIEGSRDKWVDTSYSDIQPPILQLRAMEKFRKEYSPDITEEAMMGYIKAGAEIEKEMLASTSDPSKWKSFLATATPKKAVEFMWLLTFKTARSADANNPMGDLHTNGAIRVGKGKVDGQMLEEFFRACGDNPNDIGTKSYSRISTHLKENVKIANKNLINEKISLESEIRDLHGSLDDLKKGNEKIHITMRGLLELWDKEDERVRDELKKSGKNHLNYDSIYDEPLRDKMTGEVLTTKDNPYGISPRDEVYRKLTNLKIAEDELRLKIRELEERFTALKLQGKATQYGLDLGNLGDDVKLPGNKRTILFAKQPDGSFFIKMERRGCPPIWTKEFFKPNHILEYLGHSFDYLSKRPVIQKSQSFIQHAFRWISKNIVEQYEFSTGTIKKFLEIIPENELPSKVKTDKRKSKIELEAKKEHVPAEIKKDYLYAIKRIKILAQNLDPEQYNRLKAAGKEGISAMKRALDDVPLNWISGNMPDYEANEIRDNMVKKLNVYLDRAKDRGYEDDIAGNEAVVAPLGE